MRVNTIVRRCCRATQYFIRQACSHGTRTVVQNVYVPVSTSTGTEAPQDARSIEAAATTPTMRRSEQKIEYPDSSKKSNLLQYLTILGIEHSNTQTIKELTKLLPKNWRKALPDDWQSKFTLPSPTKPHRTRSGSSNSTPTHTLSEGNPESSAIGEASPEHPGEEIESSAVHKPTVTPKQSRKMRSAPTISDVTTELDRDTGLRNLQGNADLVTQEEPKAPEVNESLREMQGDANVVIQENEVDNQRKDTQPSDTEHHMSTDTIDAENNVEEPTEPDVDETLREMQGGEDIVMEENEVGGEPKEDQPSDTEHHTSADTINAENNEEEPTVPDVDESLREMQGDEDIVMGENEVGGEPKEDQPSDTEHQTAHDEVDADVDRDEYVPTEEESSEDSDHHSSDHDSSDHDSSGDEKEQSSASKKEAVLRKKIRKNCLQLEKEMSPFLVYDMDSEDVNLIIDGNKDFWKLSYTKKEQKAAKKLAKSAKEMFMNRKDIADDMKAIELQEQEADEEFMQKYAQCKPRAFPTDEIHDRSGSVRLPAVTFFIHEDPEVSLICQPAVNHRKIAISTLETHFLPAAIETSATNVSFEEAVHIIPYELTEKKANSVPVFSAYNIKADEEMFLPRCRNIYAKYPTVGCMRETLKFLGMTTLLKRYFDEDRDKDDAPLQSTDIFVDMMTDPIFSETVYPTSDPFAMVESLKTSSEENSAIVFRNKRSEIQQNTRLRFAVMDGQHRVGIAIHVLSGYKLTNTFNKSIYDDKNMELYKVHERMKINGKPPMKFLLPTSHKLDDSFIEKCIQASMEIVDRKPKAKGNPWRKVMYDALDDGEERLTAKQKTFDDFSFVNSIFDKPQGQRHSRVMVSIPTVTNSASQCKSRNAKSSAVSCYKICTTMQIT